MIKTETSHTINPPIKKIDPPIKMINPQIKKKIWSVNAHDGAVVRTAVYEPKGHYKGVVQLVHGFGEGIEHYQDLAGFFVSNNFACVIHDQRGFGQMPGLSVKQKKAARGIVPRYEYFLEDIKTIRHKINQWYPSLPVVLFGHSMGGNIAINCLLKNFEYSKAVIEAPWLRLYRPLPKSAMSVVKFLGRIFPKITASSKIRTSHIARNGEKIRALKDDGIFHNRISFKLFSEISDAGEFALKNAALINLPTLLLCPGADKIVCPDAIREFGQNARENLKMIDYKDGYHNLHSDSISTTVLDDIMEFMQN